MVIRMRHPQHGETDVYAEAEAAANEKNGWVRVVAPAAVEQPKANGVLHLPQKQNTRKG